MRGVKLQIGKRFLQPALTEAQRYEITERVIANLRDLGRGWEWLDEPAIHVHTWRQDGSGYT
jgi:hypothetical protein